MEKKCDAAGWSLRFERKRAEIVRDPIRSRAQKVRIPRRCTQCEDSRTRCFARTNSRGRVFRDNAIRRSYSENLSALQIRIGKRFAAADIIRSDEMFRDR